MEQPTQTPAVVSQCGAALGHMAELVQDAWHWWSPGQHAGAAAGQSELAPHAAHCPTPEMQIGVGCAQSEFVAQATHPSVGSHF